jgi:hypothetical protein
MRNTLHCGKIPLDERRFSSLLYLTGALSSDPFIMKTPIYGT